MNMKIIEQVNLIRDQARTYGKYKYVSEKCGVTFHWLQKFACGSIKNPTIENIAKLEDFYTSKDTDNIWLASFIYL